MRTTAEVAAIQAEHFDLFGLPFWLGVFGCVAVVVVIMMGEGIMSRLRDAWTSARRGLTGSERVMFWILSLLVVGSAPSFGWIWTELPRQRTFYERLHQAEVAGYVMRIEQLTRVRNEMEAALAHARSPWWRRLRR